MITVQDAHRMIRESVGELPLEYQPLSRLQGRVLGEDVVAPFPLPRFTNAAMDGFALRRSDIEGASQDTPVRLQVVSEVAAGAMPGVPVLQGSCAQIMTGAPLPDGADTVVAFEQTSGFGSREVSIFSAPKRGTNIRYAGEEVACSSVLLRQGTPVASAEIAVLATLGIEGVLAGGVPRVALVTVGDELRMPGEALEGAAIYNSNRFMLQALCRAWGIEPTLLLHAPDDRAALRGVLAEALAGCDMLVTAGGISTGEYDYVQELLGETGVAARFWRVAQKPGKPLYFGTTGDNRPVFALPGNPVSAMTCFHEYVVPALCLQQGRAVPEKIEALLAEPFPADKKRYRFLPGTIWQENGRLYCRVSRKVESHMITSLAGADGIIESGPAPDALAAGSAVTCSLFPWSGVRRSAGLV
ncbi:MAG: molybdopterin molybdotransferase MoeA [Chlorobium sp.]|uniref:molybdopterin molybdotransferase MoeA n=1 Tax=Chlorobium sp. TaxID=1095 RepID=UPI0025BD1F36|nr:gephyrin-like molybdotransferase Glp [Chlorobium sp.]MCF8383266.1 molybdopterin molybdotransferase MoeA [Chlorobium sp.]